MVMSAVTLAVAAPLVLAGERSYFHLPSEGDFRMQPIERADNEREWPFTVDKGYLSCVYVTGKPTVYFTFREDADDGAAGTVVVSTDPLQLAFVNIGRQGLFAPTSGLAELIQKVAPFESLGRRLCDQPRGTVVRPGEL